mgnify:CR=1 FL=1
MEKEKVHFIVHYNIWSSSLGIKPTYEYEYYPIGKMLAMHQVPIPHDSFIRKCKGNWQVEESWIEYINI